MVHLRFRARRTLDKLLRMSSKHRWWRLRFSLRTLVVVMTIAAVFLGWFTQTALRQRRAVAGLSKLSADVVYEQSVDPRVVSWCPQWLYEQLGIDFFADATEVQIGVANQRIAGPGKTGNSKKTVVLSKRSQELLEDQRPTRFQFSSGQSGQIIYPPAQQSQLISTDTMILLRELPHLRKLTLHVSSLNTTLPQTSRATSYFGDLILDDFRLDAQSLRVLWDSPTLEELDISSVPANDELLAALHGFQNLERMKLGPFQFTDAGAKDLAAISKSLPEDPNLNLINCKITDEGAGHIGKLVEMRKLVLTNNKISDVGLLHFSRLEKLEELYLAYLPVTDEGLAHLRSASSMKVLSLTGTKITDAGITHLAGMPNLAVLDLSFTKISDQSIPQLLQFKNLWHLRLLGTEVTRNGWSQLRKGLPTATIDMSDIDGPP